MPTHNRSNALALTLAKLAQQNFDGLWEVIVVNNCSSDDTDDVVRRQSFPVPLRLAHQSTPGAAAARNAGAALARGEFIIFLDNDILVGPDFVQLHYDSLQANPASWIQGGITSLPEQEVSPFGQYRKFLQSPTKSSHETSEMEGFTAANASMPRKDLERLGGFDEKFNVASSEDLDLAIRARQVGIKILFRPEIFGVHNDWAGSSIRDYCLRQQIYSRSEPLLWSKYGAMHPRSQIVLENLPVNWYKDPPILAARKLVKQFLGNRVPESTLFSVCEILEKKYPYPPVLWRVYRLLLSAAIYKGFHEGMEIHNVR